MKKLFLTCPKCQQIWRYDSYPPDPKLSMIQCLHCSYTAPGCTFPRMNKNLKD